MNEHALKEAPSTIGAEKRSISGVIESISDNFIKDFTVEEQKEILLGIKAKICNHYESIRLDHIEGVEEYERRLKYLQA